VCITVHLVAELVVAGRRVTWRVVGSGPALLAPECNFTWTSTMVEAMSREFTVILATPTDFGASERLGAPYRADRWADDMRAVLDHVEVQRCGLFGYSFSGVFGAWLALHLPDRIAAVAAGGFPLLGDYSVTADDVRGQLSALEADPGQYATVDRDRFDPRAGMAFYDDLAKLADDALVEACPCPLYCFWGDEDADAVAMVMPSSELAAGLAARGVIHQILVGYDHEGLNADLEVAWPGAAAWLVRQLADGTAG
jgi:pimeloyl-ACP methyl ester carboxylesterase